MKKELWVPFLIHSDGSGQGKDEFCPGRQAAYDTKNGAKGAARYSHMKTPVYEDDDTLVYSYVDYFDKKPRWVIFIRKVITIDLRKTKGIPNTAKVKT
jgi:hypothetical protein